MTRVRALLASVVVLAVAAAGFAGGAFYTKKKLAVAVDRQFDGAGASAVASAPYYFINPLLECGSFAPSTNWSHLRLRRAIERYVEESVEEGTADHVSVYFRELNDGPWIGVNEEERYSPASLLKVPIMVTVLQEAERRPDFLDEMVPYTAVIDTMEVPVVRDRQIIPGNSYSVRELVTRMIRYSDNEAQHLLVGLVGRDRVVAVLREMGLADSGTNLSTDFLTVREYASVFRLLYNSTYLGRAMSEGALELLSTTTFGNGIRAALPNGVVTASKFGERGWMGNSERQMHDCGIVYAFNAPYLLCVMTRGTDFNVLTRVIADLSYIVYSHVAESRP